MGVVFVVLLLLLPLSSFCLPAEIAFSPHRGTLDFVVKTIDSAKKTVRMAAYSFTSAPIAKALVAAMLCGIDVRVVIDKSNAKARNTMATFLANQHVPVRMDYQ